MALADITITKADFENSTWQADIAALPMKDCLAYSNMFQAKADEAKAKGEDSLQAVYSLLSYISWFALNLDSHTEPLAPRVHLRGQPRASIDDIPDEHLSVLQEVAPGIADPEMRARVGDLLWIRRRVFPMAVMAISAYLDSAGALAATGYEPVSTARIERALQLAVLLGRNSPQLDTVVAHIEKLNDEYVKDGHWARAARMHELLQSQKRGDPLKYAPLAEQAASQMETEKKWYLARRFWVINAKWHAMGGESDEERASLIRAAETHVRQAEEEARQTTPNFTAATMHLEDAIGFYRSFGGNKERIAGLHSALLQYQSKALQQMGFMRSEQAIDTSRFEEHAIAQVKSKGFIEALFALATLMRSPSVGFLRQHVEDRIEGYPLYYMFELVQVDTAGKPVARRPALSPDDVDTREAAILSEMYRDAQAHQRSLAMSLVEPAREQIKLEHAVRVRDLFPIVYNNRFIPRGHERIYAEALYAGLMGDFLIACHLLTPQIENSLRYMLNQYGAITSGYTAKRIQDEESLNTILELPEINAILDRDTVFDLKGLLAERFGSNLRNETAHGLIDYGRFWAAEVSYLWWLALRLCCLFKITPTLAPKRRRRRRPQRLSKTTKHRPRS